MHRMFIRYISLRSSTSSSSKAMLRNMYKFLTGDCSSSRSSTEKVVDARISTLADQIFELDEPEILLDMRKLNGKPDSSMFDEFWKELSVYLVEVSPAVDDRRHGSTLHLPIAISIADLREIIGSRLRLKYPEDCPKLPSNEWIWVQFAPQNPYASTALRHPGKFEIKFAVQRRQLRKEHPDSKYVMILVKYVKEYAVQFRNQVVLISVDDKATIPIGEPGAPVLLVLGVINDHLYLLWHL